VPFEGPRFLSAQWQAHCERQFNASRGSRQLAAQTCLDERVDDQDALERVMDTRYESSDRRPSVEQVGPGQLTLCGDVCRCDLMSFVSRTPADQHRHVTYTGKIQRHPCK
jgi:hypothetical protein